MLASKVETIRFRPKRKRVATAKQKRTTFNPCFKVRSIKVNEHLYIYFLINLAQIEEEVLQLALKTVASKMVNPNFNAIR